MKKTLAASAALIALLLAGCAPSAPTPVHPKFASHLHDLACADDGTVVPGYEKFRTPDARNGTWVTPEACAAGPAHEAFDFPDNSHLKITTLTRDPVVLSQLAAFGDDPGSIEDKRAAAVAFFEKGWDQGYGDGWTLTLPEGSTMTLTHIDGSEHTVDLRDVGTVRIWLYEIVNPHVKWFSMMLY